MKLLKQKFTVVVLAAIIAFAVFRWGIRPAIPSSLLFIYMAIALIAIFLYTSSSDESWREFLRPVKAALIEPNKRVLRGVILIIFPLLIGFLLYGQLSPRLQPPAELRSIHPAPPQSIQFKGKNINILGLANPLRQDPANLERYLREGQEVYFSRCVFCHGDALDGRGHFAPGLNPPPADFTDQGTIAQLQESYVFWRIAKGGRGLPKESAPWNSAMPAWESSLTEEEIWQVIVYIYRAAGVSPRTWE